MDPIFGPSFYEETSYLKEDKTTTNVDIQKRDHYSEIQISQSNHSSNDSQNWTL